MKIFRYNVSTTIKAMDEQEAYEEVLYAREYIRPRDLDIELKSVEDENEKIASTT